MSEKDQQEKIWLVKSNSSILGPYLFDEVVECIFKGDIHVLDEIKGPFERWRPIRDHSLFNAAIEKLKATAFSKREFTVTDNIDMATEEITQTLTETAGFDDTKTVTLTGINALGPEERTSPGIHRDGTLPPLSQRAPEGPKVYPQPPSKKKKSSSLLPIFLLLFLLVGLAGAIGYQLLEFQNDSRPDTAGRDMFNDFTDQGVDALKVGNYEQAIALFRRAAQIDPGNHNLIMEMAPLLIHFTGDYQGVIQRVQQVINKDVKVDRGRGKNIIALGQSYMGQHELALVELNEALQLDESNYHALVNKGYELIKLGKPKQAIGLFEEAKQLQPRDSNLGRYLSIRAYVEEGIKTQERPAFEEAVQRADSFANTLRAYDFRQEALFFPCLGKNAYGRAKKEPRYRGTQIYGN